MRRGAVPRDLARAYHGRQQRISETDLLDKSRRLLGAHIVGEGATELIHIGQAVINLQGTVDFFVNNTFNYPTLAEAYKIAGLDAWNRMGIE